ncbi:MAG: PEP/pyruvate-binding domain-containing protein [Candidatus Zixiibacteriota bacterium]
MEYKKIQVSPDSLPEFDRRFFVSDSVISRIGSGAIGGKASGLAFIKDALHDHFGKNGFEGVAVGIPRMVVLTTTLFDRFMKHNNLYEMALSGEPDDYIAHTFNRGELPPDIIGDLRALIESVHVPLAVRSSSLLEDSLYEPFAGVYATKMIPNNQPDADTRFKRFIEAIKFIYASTFFKSARDYHRFTGHATEEEKMAVIVQEVVGLRHYERFYPDISGVVRSFNFYPMGRSAPEEGVVDLALGLGKTIVDGGLCWSYSPAHPRANPPVSSAGELIKKTQSLFWAVNMGKPPEYDPVKETEYLIQGNLAEAEYDGTLRLAASTYRRADDRVVMGLGSAGPRVVTFAPILLGEIVKLNDLIKKLMKLCEDAVGSAVEIEFAVTYQHHPDEKVRFGFLQVRPMVVSDAQIDIGDAEMSGDKVLAASDHALGNGERVNIHDVVYVMPDKFDAAKTRQMAAELDKINQGLVEEKRPYLLIGFGRWGSSDPWLGIPVEWSQVSGAAVMVEAATPEMNVELSQGAHFFHNLTAFEIFYFAINHAGPFRINWGWLDQQKVMHEAEYVRHVSLTKPLQIKVDGRKGRGVILI